MGGRDDSMKQITIDERRSRKTKIVLTSLAAGLLIGKGGNTIKGIQTSTQAILSITDSREGPVLGERLLTVIGDLDARNHACEQIIEVIANDASNMGNTMLRYPPSEGDFCAEWRSPSHVCRVGGRGRDTGAEDHREHATNV